MSFQIFHKGKKNKTQAHDTELLSRWIFLGLTGIFYLLFSSLLDPKYPKDFSTYTYFLFK